MSAYAQRLRCVPAVLRHPPRDSAATFDAAVLLRLRDPTTDRSFLLSPLIGTRARDVQRLLRWCTGRTKATGGFSMSIFPLVYASHKPPSSMTPLFGFNSAANGFRLPGPLYVPKGREPEDQTLFPLFLRRS